MISIIGQTPDGRNRCQCDTCRVVIETTDPPELVRCLCGLELWPRSPAGQARLLQRWVQQFYRGHRFADVDGAKARVTKCPGCRHFKAPRCSRAGDTCEARRVWFAWLLAGECPHLEERSDAR